MIKRTIVIGSRCFVSLKNEQLVVENRETGEVRVVAVEDIGYMELESPQITITVAALACLAENCVAVTFCDATHSPIALSLPLTGNTVHAERLRFQLHCSLPTQKRLWQLIVRSKIRAQEHAARAMGFDINLTRYAETVYTGDRTNREAVAAKQYWKTVLKPFGVNRDPEGTYPNNALNYGYAILRSTVARALVRAGLHPALGVHHSNRYNAFSLADDMMEPYRPFVDYHVLTHCMSSEPFVELTPEHKRYILGLLVMDTQHLGMRRPLANSVEIVCAHLVQALSGELGALDIPQFRA